MLEMYHRIQTVNPQSDIWWGVITVLASACNYRLNSCSVAFPLPRVIHELEQNVCLLVKGDEKLPSLTTSNNFRILTTTKEIELPSNEDEIIEDFISQISDDCLHYFAPYSKWWKNNQPCQANRAIVE